MWTEPFHSIYFNLKITANYLNIWIAEKKLSKRKMMKIKTKCTQWTKLIEKKSFKYWNLQNKRKNENIWGYKYKSAKVQKGK